MKRLILILALGALLAACAAGDSSEETFSEVSSGLDGGEGVTDFAGGAPTTAAAETPASPDEQVSTERQVIRTASLQLEAAETRETFEAIVSLVEGSGGFVSSATVHPVEGEDDQPVVTMSLRIPADQLSEVMAEIKGLAEEVLTETQDAQDVTDQFVDLEARLTNLQALETELVALLAEVREQPDADPAKLLTVFNEVSRVRGEIELIQGQLNYLNDVVALATLDVQLSPTAAAIPIVEEQWAPLEVARDSLRNLVAGLQNVADWLINFAIYTLPILILTLGIPLLVIWIVFRWWRKRSGRNQPPPAPEPIPPVIPAGKNG